MFLIKKLRFDRMNFLKLSVHVFCLAEKAKLRRTNSRTNCQQNKITVCLLARAHHILAGLESNRSYTSVIDRRPNADSPL
jgi:hypothetical protein